METIRRGVDGAEMILVPEGTFISGIDDEEINRLYNNPLSAIKAREGYGEKAKREDSLPSFFIDVAPVTNAQFERFVKETRYGRSRPIKELQSDLWSAPEQPVVGVGMADISAYLKWVGARLPTEFEWEKAARGVDGRIFPWGNDPDPSACNCFEVGLQCTSEVGNFPRATSPFGAVDVAGNVWEITADKWEDRVPVMRGGCYLTYLRFCRVTGRWAPSSEAAEYGAPWLGFRCASDSP